MDQHYYDQMINTITSVNDRTKTIPLKYTGLNKKGGSTLAYEFENPETHERYFLKITPNEDNGGGELRVLPKVNQLFKNEVLTEPDAIKRLGYIPVPTIITDDPAKFNSEFSQLFKPEENLIQLQTAAPGEHAERELPESITDRLSILLPFAKLLRTCAKNKIAYVDIKPLEHLFWIKQAGQVRITLIDWGIARANAEPALLADDIRKFCLMMPEVIYGKKMADLQYRGKLTYPIQTENRTALTPLLSTFTFNSELPPLSSEYAALISDLLTGSLNELRVQNRCVSIWDAIITALDQARLATQNASADAQENTAALKERAQAALKQNTPRDLAAALPMRQMTLSGHPGWITAALRFTQAWYGRVDLIPHIEFDLTVKAVAAGDIPGAENSYGRLLEIIKNKLAQGQTQPELREHIGVYLETIRQALQAWSYMDRYEKKQLTDAQFLQELSTSTLRVSDPILSDVYYSIKEGKNEASIPAPNRIDQPQSPAAQTVNRSTEKEQVTPQKTPHQKTDKPKEQKAQQPIEPKPDTTEKSSDPLIDNVIKTANALRLEADRTENFNMLRPTGFFQRLNDLCMNNRSAFENREVRKATDPLLASIIDRIDLWSQNIRPEKYFVTQEAVDSIDWIQLVSPIVYTAPIFYEARETVLGAVVKSRLSEIFQSIYYSLAKEQTAGEPPEILQKVGQIKILRKRLDMENLNYIRSLIDRGEFEAANQVINLHYSESPYTFDQLNNEISMKRKEQADQKTLSIIDSVLNDLSSNDTKLQTARHLNSPKSAAMVSDRFFTFKNRGTQLFDLQDELSRTKNAIQEQKKTIRSMRILSIGALLAAIITAVIAALLLLSTNNRNNQLQSSLNIIGTSAAQYQTENNTLLQSIALTAAVQPQFPTPVPTVIPTPTMIPTLAPITAEENVEEIIMREPTAIPTQTMSPADQRLESLIGKNATLTLSPTIQLYSTSALTTQLGTVFSYTNPITGRVVSYDDRTINIVVPFNIGRSQVATSNNTDVNAQTYVRLYSNVPSETQQIFVTTGIVSLAEPVTDCTDSNKSFCHGTFSIWLDRTLAESSLQ
ncbi:MAG: hypothetical protein II969_10705 [Anaerolineaceae bacterium]|nr:hypothetical protein [Anaerolineaceae bacterium]